MPKFEYPRFYICHTTGSYTINHRLTHSYVASVRTEEELVKRIAELNAMSDKDLWLYLMSKYVRIPKPNVSMKDDYYDDREKWFTGAWSVYTDLFYTKNPKLLVEEKQIPYEVINQIRREEYARDKEATERQRKEQEESERRYKEEERLRKEKEKKKAEPDDNGKLGSRGSLERLKKNAKKGLKKLKIKTKSNKVIDIIDSDDPFA
jgi:hypothetical protein